MAEIPASNQNPLPQSGIARTAVLYALPKSESYTIFYLFIDKQSYTTTRIQRHQFQSQSSATTVKLKEGLRDQGILLALPKHLGLAKQMDNLITNFHS